LDIVHLRPARSDNEPKLIRLPSEASLALERPFIAPSLRAMSHGRSELDRRRSRWGPSTERRYERAPSAPPPCKTKRDTQIDAARHLQQRIEVRNWFEAAEETGGTAATAKHGKRVEPDAVAHQIEHGIDIFCLGDMLSVIDLSVT
jgi:hypothetical protein